MEKGKLPPMYVPVFLPSTGVMIFGRLRGKLIYHSLSSPGTGSTTTRKMRIWVLLSIRITHLLLLLLPRTPHYHHPECRFNSNLCSSSSPRKPTSTHTHTPWRADSEWLLMALLCKCISVELELRINAECPLPGKVTQRKAVYVMVFALYLIRS